MQSIMWRRVFHRLSVPTKLELSITALALLISVGTVQVFYRCAHNTMIRQHQHRLATLADRVASHVDADAHGTLRTPQDETTLAYKRIKATLQQYKHANPDIRYIYTMRPGEHPMTWKFVVDAEVDPQDMSHIGDEYDVSDFSDMRDGLHRPTADTTITHDKWGDWISGYAPIRNKRNHSVGIVGVDLSANELIKQLHILRSVGLYCAFLAALLSIALGKVLARMLLAPLREFMRGLRSVAASNFDVVLDDSREDEIGEVAKTFNDMLQSLRQKDAMLAEMNTDYLTGLNNHRFFQQQLKEEFEAARRHGAHLSLMMIDLDRFKLVNDSFGHRAGDEILKQLGKVLCQSLPEQHLAARYGGEEFTVILRNTSALDAIKLADQVREEIASHSFFIPSEILMEGPGAEPASVSVTVSIGAASYPLHTQEPDGLIMAADIALYQAKSLGRNRVSAYHAGQATSGSDPYHVHTFLKDPSKSTIEALAAAVDARDHYTRNHSDNVSKYALEAGTRLGLPQGDLEMLRITSLLHDVGKIGIPDDVLNKPSGLTDDEMEIIRTHPSVGEAIVRNSQSLDTILPGILYHHEHYDGTGYPNGLSGSQIPLYARIIAVADTFDALTTNRPYRRARSRAAAIQVLRDNSGTQFDPEVVDAFIRWLDESQPMDMAA